MRLLLIGNYPLDHAFSMDRYVEMLRGGMASLGHEVQVLTPKPVFGRLHPRGAVGKWLGYIDKYLLFPRRLGRAARSGWDHVHLCDHSNAMYLPHLPAGRCSITCHDVIAIDAAQGLFPTEIVGRRISRTGRIQQAWIRRHLLRAERIAAVSQWTATRLREMGAAAAIEVIHLPTHRDFKPASQGAVHEVRRRFGVPEDAGYLMHIGGDSWYKNRLGALRIFAAMRRHPEFAAMHLVLAGPVWTETIRVEAEAMQGAVHAAPGISDDDLEALYTGAEALLFPSWVEGFGWPVLEAEACGTTVIASDIPPLHESAGPGAIYIDPADPQGAAAAVAAAWSTREQRKALTDEHVRQLARQKRMPVYERFFFAGRSSGALGGQ